MILVFYMIRILSPCSDAIIKDSGWNTGEQLTFGEVYRNNWRGDGNIRKVMGMAAVTEKMLQKTP